ncbi:NUDIX hydrolase [Aneurinibacillus uraniidurans]|uniref:NUDIX hydrolase n=1 Tax=Aneurinibacillus uraniidurans TaxID=2966586 RepID=UPI00234932C9|nr:CoA pyrophosphatase [Aneurinibacillus sp. B1]WCN38249.1 CoA pyrophosphatase [Aneurinibacillus sp. B1]
MLEQIQQRMSERAFNLFGFAPLMRAAIMIPLVEKDGKWHILFEVRASTLTRQPGEICFPGGKIDPSDKNEQEAAIRETCEELGIQPDDVEVIADLGVLIPPYSSSIYSFVGRIRDEKRLSPNKAEVDEVFYVPLSFFLENEPQVHYIQLAVKPDEDFPFDLIPLGKEYKWRTTRLPEFFYQYDGKIIWGLTARIVQEFISVIK